MCQWCCRLVGGEGEVEGMVNAGQRLGELFRTVGEVVG